MRNLFKRINNWLESFEPSDDDIQAELKALCYKMVAQQIPWSEDLRKYERLLTEIYKRGLEPEMKLEPKD